VPRGLSKIKQLAEDANARSQAYEAGEGGGVRALKLSPGETAIGRFLEEGENVWYLYMHELPKKPGQAYGDRIQCLDQDDVGADCPGCQIEGAKRTARMVINFIRYDEPKLRRGADGKAVKDAANNYIFDGVEPALIIWEAPQSAGGRLAYLEAMNNGGDASHGITNHVVTIARTSDNKNPWMIDVVQANKPPDPFEIELFNKKVDPPKAIQNVFPRYLSRPVMSVGDMRRAFSGVGVPSGFAAGASSGDGQPQPAGEENMYARAAQNAAAGSTGGHLNLGAFSK
jgi:hypothetical protein